MTAQEPGKQPRANEPLLIILNPSNRPIREAVTFMGSVYFTAQALGLTYDELQDLIYDRVVASDKLQASAIALVNTTFLQKVSSLVRLAEHRETKSPR